jgi:phage terminase large subunit-like protein
MAAERSMIEQVIDEAGGPEAFADLLAKLPVEEQRQIAHDWSLLARPSQLAPRGDWDTWLVMAGRGFGKTRVGAEFVRGEVEAARARRVALVAPTAADARDVMVEGESGILAISPPWFRPLYEPSKRRLTWPNGAQATLFSADEPDRLRGPQHDLAWCDEIATWFHGEAAWDMLSFGLRLGERPRAVVTTTPRPVEVVRRLIRSSRTVITRGSTLDNATNLAPSFLETIKRTYEGTRLGRQEIYAELLEDNPNALFRQADLDAARIQRAPELQRVIVGIDPSASSDASSDECGIVVMGAGPCACKGTLERHGFVIADHSAVLSPAGWAAAARRAYELHRADRIIAEKNMGGDMVEAVLRAHGAANLPITLVHASRGKMVRAEPVAGLIEQRKIHFVGTLSKLEDQLTQWDPTVSRSPDRLDAFVWAATELMVEPQPVPVFRGAVAAPWRWR